MTPKQRKAVSARMKEYWEQRRVAQTVKAREAAGVPILDLTQLLDPKKDMVNHPAHYTFSKYEVADVADEWYANEPHLWQANKYMARWDKKGDPLENLEKAVWYIQRKINKLKEQRNA